MQLLNPRQRIQFYSTDINLIKKSDKLKKYKKKNSINAKDDAKAVILFLTVCLTTFSVYKNI